MRDIVSGRTKLLYVAPESLNKEENMEFLKSVKISFYAIDEALFRISEWDMISAQSTVRFVVPSKRLALLLLLHSLQRLLIRCVRTLVRSLGIEDCAEFKSSFNRPNLYYEVRPKKSDDDTE